MLIVCGLYCVHLKSFASAELGAPLRALRERPSWLALLAGLAIAGYSIVDKVGVRYVNPPVYIYLIYCVSVLCLLPYVLFKRKPIAQEWRGGRGRILLVSLMSPLTYLLVLFALTFSQVSYIASVREVALVFAALMGSWLLREPFGRQKLVGSLLIFAGILAIALG